MAVEKKAAVAAGIDPVTAAIPATIRFYYETAKVFNSLSLRTTYRAKNIKNPAGESQEDYFAISQMEMDIVKEHLEQAIFDIFGEMFKITEGVTTPIFFNSAFTPTGGSELVASGGIIKDNAAFDENVLLNIDKKIENCIRYFILSEWYIVCSMGEDAKMNYEKYREYLRQMKNLTFSLRKPLMS